MYFILWFYITERTYSLFRWKFDVSTPFNIQVSVAYSNFNKYKNYVLPIVLYGMELLLPSSKPLEQLEMFQKRIYQQTVQIRPYIY